MDTGSDDPMAEGRRQHLSPLLPPLELGITTTPPQAAGEPVQVLPADSTPSALHQQELLFLGKTFTLSEITS